MTLKNNLFELQYRLDRAAQQLKHRGSTPPEAGWPILMGISFPKSGTNLLRQVLAAFTRVGPYADRSFDVFAAFDAETGAAQTAADAQKFLDALHPGDIAAAHFLAWSEIVAAVQSPRYINFFIYRDPRDVVISHVFYVTDRAVEHVHHRYYNDVLTNFDDRLRTSILGLPEAEVDFPDIYGRYKPYLGWLDNPAVMPIRFEDFILNRGISLERVLNHYLHNLPLPVGREAMLAILEESIVPEKSPTFRGGRVGDWAKHFKPEHKELFKEVAGDLLVRLGYETDNDW